MNLKPAPMQHACLLPMDRRNDTSAVGHGVHLCGSQRIYPRWPQEQPLQQAGPHWTLRAGASGGMASWEGLAADSAALTAAGAPASRAAPAASLAVPLRRPHKVPCNPGQTRIMKYVYQPFVGPVEVRSSAPEDSVVHGHFVALLHVIQADAPSLQHCRRCI